MSAKPSFSITACPPLLLIEVAGPFTLDDWMRVLAAIPETPGFSSDLNTLVDAREGHFDFMYDDAMKLASVFEGVLERRGKHFRSAYVVGSDVDYGVSRMVQSALGRFPMSTRTFRSMDEARAWLADGGRG